jgi:hypothetical protein
MSNQHKGMINHLCCFGKHQSPISGNIFSCFIQHILLEYFWRNELMVSEHPFQSLSASNWYENITDRTVWRPGNTGSRIITVVKQHCAGSDIRWVIITHFTSSVRERNRRESSYFFNSSTRLANQPLDSKDYWRIPTVRVMPSFGSEAGGPIGAFRQE